MMRRLYLGTLCALTCIVALPTDASAQDLEFRGRFSRAQSTNAYYDSSITPPTGTGVAIARFTADLSSVYFWIRVRNLSATPITITVRCTYPGRLITGPIVVDLLDVLPISNGILSGTVTNDDLEGAVYPCIDAVGRPVNNIAGLALAMEAGLIQIVVGALTNFDIAAQMLEYEP
jgi:hypothetical protein